MNEVEPETIGLSYLNAFEYCPRRFYYEFVQGDMLTNEFVLEGTLLHERSDQPGQHTSEAGELQINHLFLASEGLRLSGFADIVVADTDGKFVPIEYKHGRQGKWLNDHVQLCAQAMCLEEREPGCSPLDFGYVFYFGSRRRVRVDFTPTLRAHTLEVIAQAFHTATLPVPPPPLEGKQAARCRDCSLAPLCLPDEVKMLQAATATSATKSKGNDKGGNYLANALLD